MFRTHILFALFFYLLFIKIFSLNVSLVFAAILCFGSILPDIDSPSSYVNAKYLFGIGKTISAFSKHRGFWHSIFGMLIFLAISFAAVCFLKAPFVFVFALPIGYMLHLAADSFNISGIKWFWKRGRISGPIRTGSVFEQLFFIILLLGTAYIIIGNGGLKEATAFISKIKP